MDENLPYKSATGRVLNLHINFINGYKFKTNAWRIKIVLCLSLPVYRLGARVLFYFWDAVFLDNQLVELSRADCF